MQQASRAVAFECEYPRLYDRIWRYVRPRLSSDVEAEDVVAETMVEGFRTLHNFDATKGTLEQWLFGIARHKLMAAWNGRVSMVGLDDVVDVLPDGATPIEITTDIVLRCRKVMERIPTDMHPLIVMRFTEGMTFDEIAEATGKSPAALRQSFSRTFRRVRSELANVMAMVVFVMIATVMGYQSRGHFGQTTASSTSDESADLNFYLSEVSGAAGLRSTDSSVDTDLLWMFILIGALTGTLIAFAKRTDR